MNQGLLQIDKCCKLSDFKQLLFQSMSISCKSKLTELRLWKPNMKCFSSGQFI